MAWQLYAGNVKPVELKQRIQEAPVAHPERVEAWSEIGEATERHDDVHGDHGGAKIIGDGVSVTTVIKMSKQQRIKHHNIETKPQVH